MAKAGSSKYSEAFRKEVCDYYLEHMNEKGVTMRKVGAMFGMPEKGSSALLSQWLMDDPRYTRQRTAVPEEDKIIALAYYHETVGATWEDLRDKFGHPRSYRVLQSWLSEYPQYRKLRGTTKEQRIAVCEYAVAHPEETRKSIIEKFGYPSSICVLNNWIKQYLGASPKMIPRKLSELEIKKGLDYVFEHPETPIREIEMILGYPKSSISTKLQSDPRWREDSRRRGGLWEKKQEVVEYYFDNPSLSPKEISAHFGGKPSVRTLSDWVKEDPRYLDPTVYGYTEEQKKQALDLHFSQPEVKMRKLEKILGFPLNRRAWKCWVTADPRCDCRDRWRERKAYAVAFQVKADAVLAVRNEGATPAESAARYNIAETTVRKLLWIYDKGGLIALVAKKDVPKRGKNLQTTRKTAKRGAGALSNEEIQDLIRRNEELEARNEELQFENDVCHAIFDVLKKDPRLSEGELLTVREKTLVINALRPKYKLRALLERFGMPKSTYEYNRNALLEPDKYEHVRGCIHDAYEKSGHAYGYRRITAVLRLPVLEKDEKGISGYGVVVDEKVVRRLMKEEGIVTLPAMRLLRYNSYRGSVGKTAPNLLKRDFLSDAPYRKLLTDVTEFHLNNYKVYLSPVLDCFNGEIISWTVSQSPNLELVTTMLENAVRRVGRKFGVVIHSDQGWAYQHASYRQMLADSGWTQSMSRKGCCSDNSAMEGFFGRLKNEFFYNHDFAGCTPEEFMAKLNDWIIWHNEKRIKETLGYTSPVLYREQWEKEHAELPMAA